MHILSSDIISSDKITNIFYILHNYIVFTSLLNIYATDSIKNMQILINLSTINYSLDQCI